jgi:hypothetical protein
LGAILKPTPKIKIEKIVVKTNTQTILAPRLGVCIYSIIVVVSVFVLYKLITTTPNGLYKLMVLLIFYFLLSVQSLGV